ncbi:hypothetical protein GCM10011332_32510 [Terasakiella brassicae]|jgi:hypothetical protein|uniref:Uncharacterized protein n=1 Tax=Terasakiella brassicae TaxID=1634917 RepID=A0A917C8P8_9PROT|nr:hypothetical protein [Terasakiella brassicae]GGF76038.1 hypothetical protein GCM10011332_32510 [Terasakiella brassicae]
MSSWVEKHLKASELIQCGFDCLVQVPNADVEHWCNRHSAFHHLGYNYFMTKSNYATLVRCKFDKVIVEKKTAYEIANLVSTYYEINFFEGQSGEEVNITHIFNGKYGNIILRELDGMRFKWSYHGNHGWITERFADDGEFDLEIYLCDEKEFSNSARNKGMSFSEYAEWVEASESYGYSNVPDDVKGKLLDYDYETGKPFDYKEMRDLHWVVSALAQEGIYTMPDIPDPEMIKISGINEKWDFSSHNKTPTKQIPPMHFLCHNTETAFAIK